MSPFANLLDQFKAYREKMPAPVSFEALHREIKGVHPTLHLIDGAKFELTSMLSPNFMVSHSFAWGSSNHQQPPSYHFGAGYHTAKYMMHGQVDHDGNLSARANYNWIPAPTPVQPTDPNTPPPPPPTPRHGSSSKFQGQFSGHPENNMFMLEHEYLNNDFTINVRAINPNPIASPASYVASNPPPKGRTHPSAVTGIYSVSYLQSVSKSLSLGGEFTLQRLTADMDEPSTTLALRYAPPASELPAPTSLPPGMPSPYMPINPNDPTQVFTTTFSPSTGMLHASYWRRLNQRLEVAAETQMLMTPAGARGEGRREGIAAVGFKLDTVHSTIRGMFDSHGKVSAHIEERMAPGLTFQISGEIDYAKGAGGAGRVGVGFTLEA
ncbi:eukaryotic porin/Tom40 [Polychytrium aggregatum]|uniref:eukaryotic porin/Tom40 n=1 Tax=Polychytrium aggregatum TaxID=110093 RepID=UPI0022FF1AC5|nr:eukaryotic porin/Tom40 [Polychytrium aggregatum]KAI9209842.1 eukaryotic porin/Tom40 [Polychytrium aggregatum]